MTRVWDWFACHLLERLLRPLDRVPFVVVTRRGRWESEFNAFTLGRDYERGLARSAEQS